MNFYYKEIIIPMKRPMRCIQMRRLRELSDGNGVKAESERRQNVRKMYSPKMILFLKNAKKQT